MAYISALLTWAGSNEFVRTAVSLVWCSAVQVQTSNYPKKNISLTFKLVVLARIQLDSLYLVAREEAKIKIACNLFFGFSKF